MYFKLRPCHSLSCNARCTSGHPHACRTVPCITEVGSKQQQVIAKKQAGVVGSHRSRHTKRRYISPWGLELAVVRHKPIFTPPHLPCLALDMWNNSWLMILLHLFFSDWLCSYMGSELFLFCCHQVPNLHNLAPAPTSAHCRHLYCHALLSFRGLGLMPWPA